MKSKIFGLMSLSVLALVIFVGMVSATDCLRLTEVSVPKNVSHDVGTIDFSFNISHAGGSCGDKTNVSITFSSNKQGTFSNVPLFNMASTDSPKTINAQFDLDKFQKGDIIITVEQSSDSGADDPSDLSNIKILESKELSVSSKTIAQGEDSTTITITNEGNVALTGITLTSDNKDFDVTLSPSSIASLSAGDTQPVEVKITSGIDDLELGSNSVTITATADDETTTADGEVSTDTSFCDCDNEGELEISIKDITNRGFSNEKFGDDDEWFPLEEIEVEIEVENKGDYDVDDIEVVWGLYDEDSQEWLIEEEESDFNLGDGKDKTIIVSFKLEDVEDLGNNEDYVFYVKATGDIDGGDYEGDETCASDSENIKMIIENDFVVVDEIEFPETVQCGDEVKILADIWNIGEDDQDEVSVFVYNQELGINEKVEMGDIDAFDNEKLEVTIKIPKNADEKWYSLIFRVYDEDNDLYENDYDDDEAKFNIPIKVSGNCEVASTALVSPVLESGGKAGQELVIKATITNTGTELVNYVLSATETDWASSVEFDETAVILSAGESKDVLVTLDVNKDVSGEKEFNINVFSSDGELITKQPVSVLIEGSEGFNFSGLMQDNWYLWVIGAVNIILVIIIILVAVRVAKR